MKMVSAQLYIFVVTFDNFNYLLFCFGSSSAIPEKKVSICATFCGFVIFSVPLLSSIFYLY
jgi:hypothetical protein